MRVLLTGATGFLGRRVLRELLAQDLIVRCAVRPGSDVNGLKAFVSDKDWSRVETATVSLNHPEGCRSGMRRDLSPCCRTVGLYQQSGNQFRDTNPDTAPRRCRD